MVGRENDNRPRPENKHFLEVTIVIDLTHVLGRLRKAVWVFCAEADVERSVTERLLDTLRDRSSEDLNSQGVADSGRSPSDRRVSKACCALRISASRSRASPSGDSGSYRTRRSK